MKRRRRKALTFWGDIVRQQRATKRSCFETPTLPMLLTNPNTPPQSSALDPVMADRSGSDLNANISSDSTEEHSNQSQQSVAEGTSVMNEIEQHNPRSCSNPGEDDDIKIYNDTVDDPRESRCLHEASDDDNEFQPFEEREDYARSAATLRQTISLSMTDPSRRIPTRSTRKDPDLNLIQDRLSEWKEDLSLTALIAVVGSVRFTVQQYNFTRDILLECSAGDIFPPYSKTQQRFQSLTKHCLPSSAIVRVPKKSSTASYQFGQDGAPHIHSDSSNISMHEREEIRVFLPSSWAKLDIATSITFDRMFPGYPDFSPKKSSLEYSTIIQRRSEITNACEQIYALYNNDITPCQIGDVLRITTEGQIPALGNHYDISSSDDFHKFFAKISATWCVGSENAATNSLRRLLNASNLSDEEKQIIRCLSTGLSPHQVSGTTVPIHPGDLCTLLTPVEGKSSSFAILIHTFWRYKDGFPSSSLISVRLQSEAQHDNGLTPHEVQFLSKSLVRRTTLRERQGGFDVPNDDVNRSMGKLSDGTPYVVYRILLYYDDFQKSSAMYPKGSAGGCYFLPISLPPEDRRSRSSVRIISLTPPEVSTNDVLQYITSDFVNAAVHGVDSTTPLGEYVKVFIDPVAFIGDYPASAETIDVIGHIGRASCTLCTFRRLDETETTGSRFGYTTDVHSRNSAFIRHDERQRSFRTARLPDSDARRLGMIASMKTSDRRCPLLHLQSSLEANMSRASLTEYGTPAVSCMFDAYRSNLIAPDHLLLGLSKHILNAVFLSLPSDALRDKADISICDALRETIYFRRKKYSTEERTQFTA